VTESAARSRLIEAASASSAISGSKIGSTTSRRTKRSNAC